MGAEVGGLQPQPATKVSPRCSLRSFASRACYDMSAVIEGLQKEQPFSRRFWRRPTKSIITSNADHFLPTSGTARRFFVPTVSADRMQDFAYFNDLRAQLESGGYEALLYHFLCEVDLKDFNVRDVPKTAGLIEQRNHSLNPLEAWRCELLETGTLMGADPLAPNQAVSNAYTRQIEIETKSRNGDTNTQIRHVNQPRLYDQAKIVEPRLRNHTSDHKLGAYLSEMGCGNRKRVLRRRGWTFPPLFQCRAEWEKRFPDWKWRDAEIAEWRAEEADDDVA
jgi:hypothetical protein